MVAKVISDSAKVTRMGIFSMQVCVPKGWTDGQVKTFADEKNECGTTTGWYIRKAGSKLLKGMPERNPCANRKGFVHIMLDA